MANRGAKNYSIIAPVTGEVQQLAVATICGVVTAADPLMVIVPADNTLMIEGYIANRDIAQVQIG